MCLYPRTAWQLLSGGSLTFSPPPMQLWSSYRELQVPCGKCVECALAYSKEWQVRLLDELSAHRSACMVTLTYSEKYNPLALVKSDLQKFIKRVRKHFEPQKVRYFGCGEYGGKNARPHYHVILFGVKFDDRYVFFRGESGFTYRSPTLENLWRFGFSSIIDVTPESCKYVAKYLQKIDPRPQIVQPFVLMSKKPAIGLLNGLSGSRLRTDKLTVQGITVKLPRAYLRYAEKYYGVDLTDLKERRVMRISMRRYNRSDLLERRANYLKIFGILYKVKKSF